MKRKIVWALLLCFAISFGLFGCAFESEGKYRTTSKENKAKTESDSEASDEDSESENSATEDTETESAEAEAEETETEEAAAEEAATEDAEAEEDYSSYPVGTGRSVYFSTVDIYGNEVSSDMFADAKLIMLNLWEPWCGPCVGEMPDLEKLYRNYKDKGLLIIGAYETFDMDADAEDLVRNLDITYPIIKCSDDLFALQQEYVPATYMIDHNGNLITQDPYAGAKSYESWEKIIKEYLD